MQHGALDDAPKAQRGLRVDFFVAANLRRMLVDKDRQFMPQRFKLAAAGA